MDLFYMMNPFDELLYSTFLKKEDINIWFSCISISFLSIPAKWKSFHSILNNIFLGNEKREEMIDVISKNTADDSWNVSVQISLAAT
jgi:hypothetical protein